MSRYLVDRILRTPNIEAVIQHDVCALVGTDELDGLRIAHKESGAIRRAASAVGEGSMAVRLCHMHLAETRGGLLLPDVR